MAKDYSLYIASEGVHGPGAYAYSKPEIDARDKTAIPSGYTILGPDMIKKLKVVLGVTTVADFLEALDIEDGITELDG